MYSSTSFTVRLKHREKKQARKHHNKTETCRKCFGLKVELSNIAPIFLLLINTVTAFHFQSQVSHHLQEDAPYSLCKGQASVGAPLCKSEIISQMNFRLTLQDAPALLLGLLLDLSSIIPLKQNIFLVL